MKKRKSENKIPTSPTNTPTPLRSFQKLLVNRINVHELSHLKWYRAKLAYCTEVRFEKNIKNPKKKGAFDSRFLRLLNSIQVPEPLYETLCPTISHSKLLRHCIIEFPKRPSISSWKKLSSKPNLRDIRMDLTNIQNPERKTLIIKSTQASNVLSLKMMEINPISEEQEDIIAKYLSWLPFVREIQATDEIFSKIGNNNLRSIIMETENLKYFSKIQNRNIEDFVNTNALQSLGVTYIGAAYDCTPVQRFLERVHLTNFFFTALINRETDPVLLGLMNQRDLRVLNLDMFFTRNIQINYTEIFEKLTNLKDLKIRGRNAFYEKLVDILKPLRRLNSLRLDVPLDLKDETALDLAEVFKNLQDLKTFHFVFRRDLNFQTTFDTCIEMLKGLSAISGLEEISLESGNTGYDIFSPSNARLVSKLLSTIASLKYIRIVSFDTNHSYFGLSDILQELNKLNNLKYLKIYTRKVTAPPFIKRDNEFELLYQLEYKLNYFDIRELQPTRFMEWFTRKSQFKAEPLYYISDLDRFEERDEPVIPQVDMPMGAGN